MDSAVTLAGLESLGAVIVTVVLVTEGVGHVSAGYRADA